MTGLSIAAAMWRGPVSFVTIRSQLVNLDVVVKDGKGRYVTDLKAEDFEVYDGRKRQPVTGFEVLDLEVPAATAAGARPQPVPAAAFALASLVPKVSTALAEASRG